MLYKTKKEDTTKREVGERWIDDNGTEWEQREGFRIQNPSKGDMIKSIREYLNKPKCCPNCGEEMTKRLDSKYWNLHKMCMDCVIEMETKLKYTGKYKEYEQTKMLENIKSWLNDAEKEKEVLKRSIEKIEYANEDGTLEKWDLPYSPQELAEKIDRDFENLKTDLLTKYEKQ